MFKGFKEFIVRGNVLDLAVAVIIGAAFGVIIASLVDDILTPLLLAPALKAAGAEDIATLSWNGVKYGKFIAALLKFLIIAFVLFLIVRAIHSMKKKQVAEIVVTGPTQEELLTEIRDLLRNRQ